MVLFFRTDETGVPGENLSVQRKEPTNSTQIWRLIWESNPGHIGGRRVLSPLCNPCTQSSLSGVGKAAKCEWSPKVDWETTRYLYSSKDTFNKLFFASNLPYVKKSALKKRTDIVPRSVLRGSLKKKSFMRRRAAVATANSSNTIQQRGFIHCRPLFSELQICFITLFCWRVPRPC